MSYRFFQVANNKFHPRLVGGSSIEFNISSKSLGEIHQTAQILKIEEIISTPIDQLINPFSVGESEIEEIVSKEEQLILLSSDKTELENVVSNKVISYPSNIDKSSTELVFIYQIIEPMRSVNRSSVELPISILTKRIISDSDKVRIEQNVSFKERKEIESVGKVHIENFASEKLTIYQHNIIRSVNSSKTENNISNNATELNISTRGDSEPIFSQYYPNIRQSVNSTVEISIRDSSLRQKQNSVNNSKSETLFIRNYYSLGYSSNSKSELDFIDRVRAELNWSAKSVAEIIENENANERNVLVDYAETEEVISTNVNVHSEAILDKAISEISIGNDLGVGYSSSDKILSEYFTSDMMAHLRESVDKCIIEIFSNDNLSENIKLSLSKVILEQVSSEILSKLKNTLGRIRSEIVVSAPPIPDYGGGIGARLNKIFVEVSETILNTYLLKRIFIEQVVQEISTFFTNVYLISLQTEISVPSEMGLDINVYNKQFITETAFTELGGAGIYAYLMRLTSEMSYAEDTSLTKEYIKTLRAEICVS